ncbi:anaerobic ribonucleoside-triphosphate reductase [Candidatus Omnitrophota bacterium]
MMERECNVEVFARVTGFFRPVQSWNKGKTEEFKDRKKYDIISEEEYSHSMTEICPKGGMR